MTDTDVCTGRVPVHDGESGAVAERGAGWA